MQSIVHVYAGTAGHSAWFSEDMGMSWLHPNSHSGMYLEARVWCFSSHQQEERSMYAGTDMGVFRWDEVNARWTHLPSPMTDVWALTQHPLHPHILIAGTRPASFYRSMDSGTTWELLQAPGISQFSDVNMGPTRVTQIIFDPLNAQRIWASVEIGGIFFSDDLGLTWEPSDKGLISSDVHGLIILPNPEYESVMYATTNLGLHRSLDQGKNWTHVNLNSPWQYTRSISMKTDDPSVVFLSNGNGPPGNDGKFFRSINYGFDWEEVLFPLDLNSTLWCISTNSSDPNLLFACTNLGQLFISKNAGISFESLPHEFGELRSLHWRPLPIGTRVQNHSVTRPIIKAKDFAQMQESQSK